MPDKPPAAPGAPFWRKRLEEMSESEWESLCDGCGRCCLVKLEDEDTGRIHFTSLGCRLLQTSDCRCADYPHRQSRVPDCVKLTPQVVADISWLPPTCAYRLVDEGKDLPWWHPLVSGSQETVSQAGISARGRISASEDDVPLADYPDFIVNWPTRKPRAASAQGQATGQDQRQSASRTVRRAPRRTAGEK